MNWKDEAATHLTGDGSFRDRHLINPPFVHEENTPDSYKRCGDLRLYDLGAAPHPECLKAVAIIRCYFCREMEEEIAYRYEAERGFVLAKLDVDSRVVVLGALDVEMPTERLPQVLWAWLHPYLRRTGIMGKALVEMRSILGDFTVQFPVSSGMRSVLRRIGHPQAENPNPSFTSRRYQ